MGTNKACFCSVWERLVQKAVSLTIVRHIALWIHNSNCLSRCLRQGEFRDVQRLCHEVWSAFARAAGLDLDCLQSPAKTMRSRCLGCCYIGGAAVQGTVDAPSNATKLLTLTARQRHHFSQGANNRKWCGWCSCVSHSCAIRLAVDS
jgi:hypothetical protein